MKPASFQYHRADSIAHAVSLLASLGEDARAIAGGQSLVPMMNMRMAQPAHLVDLRAVNELRGIRLQDGWLEIGAMTTHHEVATSTIVRRGCPMLATAARTIAHYAIRTQGTFGGSIAHADPAAQLPLVMVAVDGQLELAGPGGTRSVTAGSFFLGLMTTELAPDEILVRGRLRPIQANQGQAFTMFNRRHGDYAIVAVAVDLRVESDRVAALRIALGGVAATPIQLDSIGAAFDGAAANPATADLIARGARATVTPLASPGISITYRSELVEVLTARAVREAIARARGEVSV